MTTKNPIYVIIVGGGNIGYYLAKQLIDEGHEILLIEKERKRLNWLQQQLGDIAVLGDGCEIRTMDEAGMGRANVVVAVTGDDEDNLVICQMAKKNFEISRALARVNDPKNEELFRQLGIDQTVSSTRIIFNLLEQQIESCQVIPLAALRKGEIEVVEANIDASSPVNGLKIGQLDLPPNSLVISVIRDGHASIPHGDTKLRTGDSIISLIKADREKEFRAIFTSSD